MLSIYFTVCYVTLDVRRVTNTDVFTQVRLLFFWIASPSQNVLLTVDRSLPKINEIHNILLILLLIMIVRPVF